jgi:hypothetical protein
MELSLKNLKNRNPVGNRIEALKTLTKLLLHEVESLEEITCQAKPLTSLNNWKISV